MKFSDYKRSQPKLSGDLALAFTVANFVIERRIGARMDVQGFAFFAGVSDQEVNNVEGGFYRDVRKKSVTKILRAALNLRPKSANNTPVFPSWIS